MWRSVLTVTGGGLQCQVWGLSHGEGLSQSRARSQLDLKDVAAQLLPAGAPSVVVDTGLRL